MVKKLSTKNRFFYIQCGDWDASTVAPTPREACINVLDQTLDRDSDAILTDVVIAMDCANSLDNNHAEVTAFPVSQLLTEI